MDNNRSQLWFAISSRVCAPEFLGHFTRNGISTNFFVKSKFKSCPNWYHLKCGKRSDDAKITEIDWYCESCRRTKNKEKDTPQMKLFLRYVDDIVRTVRGEPTCLLDAANSLHPNLQFTLEKTNSEGNLPFLDLNKCIAG